MLRGAIPINPRRNTEFTRICFRIHGTEKVSKHPPFIVNSNNPEEMGYLLLK
jgi:hypothetical protein